MTIHDVLGNLLATGSSERVVLLSPDTPQSVLTECLVALANAFGGHLIIGMDGDAVRGVPQPHNTSDDVLRATLATEPPLIIPLPQRVSLGDHVLIMVTVPAGLPHVYATPEGRYLRRVDRLNKPLSPVDLRRLMLTRGELSFESEATPGATRYDLDPLKVEHYLRTMKGFENEADELLLRRGCLIRIGDALRPTNAGMLLFGRDPQRFFKTADIAAVRFSGEKMTDSFARQDIGGTLVDQIRRAEAFLTDNLRREVVLSDAMARRDTFEYPLEATRELVINALAHRDYSISGDNIKLFLFSNRLEIYSPGSLPGYMTVANLRDERYSRNPIIVQVLSDLLYIERLGYGVDRVMELMKLQRLRAPEFNERPRGFMVTLYNVETAIAAQATPTPAMPLQGVYQGTEVNPRQEAAIQALLKPDISRLTNSDLQTLFPDVHSETLRRDLADLVAKNIFVKLGQKRGSYYMLYREGMPLPDNHALPQQ